MRSIDKEIILKELQLKSDRPMLLTDLLRRLGLPKEARKELKKALRKMVQEGDITQLRGARYGLPQKANLVTGRLKGHRDGYAFLLPEKEGDSDVYIGAKNLNEAMHGDRVVAQVDGSKRGGKREGRVIRVLERAHARIVGRFELGREFGFIHPSDKRIVQDLFVTLENSGSAKAGDIVLAEIITYPTKGGQPEGKVIKVIGRADDPRIDTEMVIESYEFSRFFPTDVIEEAERVSAEAQPEALQGRTDLRDLPTVTIDGERARDFDDAISIEREGDSFRLWVHIADVGHYVPSGSALDREAYLRGTSVYFPDAVLPMFPERLSNGICSLNPKEERLTLTAEMQFSADGTRSGYKIYKSVIRSNERMTYTAVRQILVDRDPLIRERYAPLLPQFESMLALAMKLRQNRLQRGSLDFDLPEPGIILSLTGETIDIIREERNIAHQIIEEFMLSANETVAEHMTSLEVPFIYRIHEPPSPTKIAEFNELLKTFGLALRGEEEIRPRALSVILEQVKDRPEERLINQVLLRSMKQAKYSAENQGHFGLASEEYTHFTSPIRRYPDLIVHRLVKETLQDKMTPGRRERWEETLPEMARHASERERVAMEAEREVIQRKKVRFMVNKVGEVFDGFISGVAGYGFFVELSSFFVEGLVHVSSLDDDYYLYDERRHALLGERRHRVFRLGDPVRVRVDKVDTESSRIDFGLLEEPAPRRPKKK